MLSNIKILFCLLLLLTSSKAAEEKKEDEKSSCYTKLVKVLAASGLSIAALPAILGKLFENGFCILEINKALKVVHYIIFMYRYFLRTNY